MLFIIIVVLLLYYYVLLYSIIFDCILLYYTITYIYIYILQYVIYICEYMIDSLFFWYSIVTFRFSTMSSTQMSNWPLPLQVAWQFHKGYGRREVKPREVLPALQVGPDYCWSAKATERQRFLPWITEDCLIGAIIIIYSWLWLLILNQNGNEITLEYTWIQYIFRYLLSDSVGCVCPIQLGANLFVHHCDHCPPFQD